MYVVKAARSLSRLVIDAEERGGGRGIGSAAPNLKGVTPAADNQTEMVPVGVARSIVVAGGEAEIELNHAVSPEVEQPNEQT